MHYKKKQGRSEQTDGGSRGKRNAKDCRRVWRSKSKKENDQRQDMLEKKNIQG